MALLKDGLLTEDPYTNISAADSVPAEGAILVSLEQWLAQRQQLESRPAPLGVILGSAQKPHEIADDIQHFDLIALDFPAFGDGRAYSYARLLRDQYQYQGELRAVGDVLLEQLHFMHRVGFNAFQINDDNAADAWETAAADLSVWYQPTGDGRTSVLELRHRS